MKQQARGFHGIGREHVNPPARHAAASVRAPEADRRHPRVFARLHEGGGGSFMQRGALRLGPAQVDRGVVLGGHRTDGDAAGAAAAGRAALVYFGVARLRRGPHAPGRIGQRALAHSVQPAGRNGRHRERAGARRAQVVRRISRHAEFALGRKVIRLDFVVAERPIHAAPEPALHPEIARQETHAGAQPMPRGAAHCLEIGALELVGPRLAIPVIGVLACRKVGLRRALVRTFRRLDGRAEKSLEGARTAHARTGFQDGGADALAGQPVGQQRPGESGTHHDRIGGDVAHGMPSAPAPGGGRLQSPGSALQ